MKMQKERPKSTCSFSRRTFPGTGGVSSCTPLLTLPTWVALVVGLLWGCAVGPNFVPPEAPEVDRYTPGEKPTETVEIEGKRQYFQTGEEISRRWWELFDSDPLNSIIKTAVSNNPTLQGAQSRLRRAQENLNAGYGAYFPQFNGTLDVNRQKFTSAQFGGNFGSSLFTLYSAVASVSYNFDIFGRTRRTVEGLAAQTDYQNYEVQATYLTLLGQVITAVISQALYRSQIKATEEIIDYERKQLDIVEIQYKAGMIPKQDLLSLRAQLATTEATLPPFEQALSQTRHLLATLIGRLPSTWTPPPIDLEDLVLPHRLPVSVPSSLVRKRPDILAAEALLHVASANIGVATASLFPSLNLTGSYGQNSTSTGTLFDSASNFWNLGAGLLAPLFHGGTLWFQRKAAIAAYDAALADYRQTVLGAFAQVADALRALEHDAMTMEAQSRALESADEALKLFQVNYQAGKATYLQVLVADQQYQQARLGYIRVQAQRYLDTAALFVALGGGWWHEPESAPEGS